MGFRRCLQASIVRLGFRVEGVRFEGVKLKVDRGEFGLKGVSKVKRFGGSGLCLVSVGAAHHSVRCSSVLKPKAQAVGSECKDVGIT